MSDSFLSVADELQLSNRNVTQENSELGGKIGSLLYV